MMDYSKLSDDEIASKVLIAQGYKLIDGTDEYSIYISESGRKDTGPKASKNFVFDPCNNPTDAWPIILEQRIALMPGASEHGTCQWWDAQSSCQKYGLQYQDNPLRAAMIVYLMMNEVSDG